MSDICSTCGGYTGNGHIVRRMPAANASGDPYPIADVPPVDMCRCNKGIAGHFIMGDAPLNHYASDVPWTQPPMDETKPTQNGGVIDSPPGFVMLGDGSPEYVYLPKNASVYPTFATEDQFRAFIRAEVRKVLEDDAREIRENKAFQPVSTHEHRRVEMTEESGKQWRGVLYRVDDAATDPEIPAVVPPEQREHRG